MTDIDDWCDWYRASGASPGTIRVRRCHVQRFAAVADLATATEADAVAFMAAHAHLRPESRKSLAASLRAYYRWAVPRGRATCDPTTGLRPVRVPPGVPHPITEDALRVAVHAADPETLLMLLLGSYAGLRRAEIAAVHERDLEGLTLVVRGKGGRVRRVPIHPMLAGRLAKVRGYAFPSPVHPGEHVTPDYVADRLSRVLPPPWTAHSLRHRFATRVYEATHDLRSVQELLGHSRPETTARYTLISEDRLTAAVLAVA